MNAIESFANTSEVRTASSGFVGAPTGTPIATAAAVVGVAAVLFVAGIASDAVETNYSDTPDLNEVGGNLTAKDLVALRESAFAV